MSNEPSISRSHPAQRLFGALLMAVGGLIAGLCGLCTGTIGLVALFESLLSALNGTGNLILAAMIVFITGVLPTAIGVVLFLTGRKLWNPAAPPLFKRRARPQG